MSKSLLFIPDISGFTEFIQTTEVEHSQHVISELLEVLIEANTEELQLAEVEGDALFFFKEEIPSLEKLLAQVETMFTAFYSHLKLLEENRICPCHACATAPNLQLKIIITGGELQFITVQNNRKPFGSMVIEAHRLLKNSVDSNNYVLMSKEITKFLGLPDNYQSRLYDFKKGKDEYDGKQLNYIYSIIEKKELKLKPFSQAKKIKLDQPPSLYFTKEFPISATDLLTTITSFAIRGEWVEGVDRFEYNEQEVNRLGTEHVCVINNKHFDFITVTKEGKPGQIVYGELTTTPAPVDELYQFFIISPISNNSCKLEIEIYWKAKSIVKKIMIQMVAKRSLYKSTETAINNLFTLVLKRAIQII